MNDILTADIKFKLWTIMREDLIQYVPEFKDTDTLLCPVCCRSLKYDEFSLEHILPQQTVKLDPADVRNAVTKNERSGLTLLCSKTLTLNDKPYLHGCNGWKGRNFDTRITEILKSGPFPRKFSVANIIALVVLGYLGLFKQYGYKVALTESGLIVRNQFFNPRHFTKNFPLASQMALRSDGETVYAPENHAYWSDPVKVLVDNNRATVVIRNFSVFLSLSHDPTVPLAKTLAYVPQKYTFRPDLRLAFQ